MSTTLLTTVPERSPKFHPRMELDLQVAVRSLLGTQHPRVGTERRREQRFPYPYPIRLTPVSTDGTVPPAESVVVLGKHLTEHGIDFYYRDPLPYRRVIATFERGERAVVHLLLELTWCRFGRHGWYENGGRFLQVLKDYAACRVEDI